MKFQVNRTRLAAIVSAAALLGGVAVASAVGSFSDVEDNQFYSDAVDWAAENGVTEGTGDGNFSPARALTRAEGVTMLHRFDENVVDALETSVDALEMANSTNGMNFSPIRVFASADGLDGVGTTITLGELDGVSIKMQCYSGTWLDPDGVPEGTAVDVGLYIYVESTTDGWYGGWEEAVLAAGSADRYDYVDNSYAGEAEGYEYTSYEIDGTSVVTPNGGYMAIDGETTRYIMSSSVRGNDCEFWGMLQWVPVPTES